MEIILKENVIGLGYKDDIVTVKDGYGRNYLIPTGKAIIASESAKKILAENLSGVLTNWLKSRLMLKNWLRSSKL